MSVMDDNEKFHAKRALRQHRDPNEYDTLAEFREAAALMYLEYLDSTLAHFNALKFWYTYEDWRIVVEEVWEGE